ncbi:hypothetical protein LPAF129_12260 [Ligilactobacillus pabuli]|uniref:Fe3+ hydroxamate ABC transporter substrate-binding protein n=1 Tax=Ligilactobacillus pabuli TaxID=2886039 RepID=A0ABQ5JL21_9LACO|nr:hypothetical protein LPAF129_12260 [Ligilactobacillus pabuli]
MKFSCVNCGRPIEKWTEAYWKFPLPEKGMTEIQAFLKLNAKAYCVSCVELKGENSRKSN